MAKVFPLNYKTIDKYIKKKSGVYQIRCYNKGKPLILGRLLNEDRLGILYIGFSSNINRRLKEFMKGMNDKSREHPAGYKYFILELYKKRKFRKNNLRFNLYYLRDYKKEEVRLLMGYADYFGELPPLNNRDVKEIHWGLNFRKYPKDFD